MSQQTAQREAIAEQSPTILSMESEHEETTVEDSPMTVTKQIEQDDPTVDKSQTAMSTQSGHEVLIIEDPPSSTPTQRGKEDPTAENSSSSMPTQSEQEDAENVPANVSTTQGKPERLQCTEKQRQLLEAWESKRQAMLQSELSSLSDRANPHLLGRSASDCGTSIRDEGELVKPGLLKRRASFQNCSKPKQSFWGLHACSLSDYDFEELQGFMDLGFQFDQNSCSELWDMLPALEVCCAIAQNFQDPPCCMASESSAIELPAEDSTPAPTPSWTIANPGDDEEEIKARLKHWARAVAFTARLCC